LIASGFATALISVVVGAQALPPKSAPPRPAVKPAGTLAQVMRGIYFPNANLIFDVQHNDPGIPRKKADSGSSTDTYASAYSEWDKVENAAIALADGVDLILKSGRMCQNGKPVPVTQPDFQTFARAMREAGIVALQAARTKSQEKVSDATNNIAEACSNCHEIYRDKGPADSPARCTPPTRAAK